MTLQDLKYRVLLRLGVVAAGDSPEADDSATVLLRYNALHALLLAQELIDWDLSEDIPDEFEVAMVPMVAAECARDFGNLDGNLQIEGRFGLPILSIAERTLRRLGARTYVSTPSQSEYF